MKAGAEIAKSVDSIRDQVELLRGHLQGARFPQMPEKCRQELTGASVRLSSISAECNRIQATISAADGNIMSQVKQMPADALELHPANLPPQPQKELTLEVRARMLQTLDRVKDDTFKEEEGAE